MTLSPNPGVGVKFEWFDGMAADTAIEYSKTNSTDALNADVVTSGGVTKVDTSLSEAGALHIASNTTPDGITAVSSAAIPVVTNADANGLIAGDVVRLYSIAGAAQLDGYDFTVGHNTLSTTTFSLDYMATIVAAAGTFTPSSFRKIPYDPIFYPRVRLITKISKAASAVITMSVTHGYKVGQKVSFRIPEAFGMVQMDNLEGTITAINTTLASGNTITVDIDSSAFTAFAFPLTAAAGFSPALVVPVGEDVSYAVQQGLEQLGSASSNEGYLGLILAGGANSPGGADNDVLRWTTYSSVIDTTEAKIV